MTRHLFFLAIWKIQSAKQATCVQVVSFRLKITESVLQKTAEEQGASEAIGDKLVNKAVAIMDSMATLVDR